MSIAIAVHPIVAAMEEAKTRLDAPGWVGSDEKQHYFLAEIYKAALSDLRENPRNITGTAQIDGLDVRLRGSLSIKVEWKQKGWETIIIRQKQQWPGVELTVEQGVSFHRSSHLANPVVMIQTKGAESVFFYVPGRKPTRAELEGIVEEIMSASTKREEGEYGSVVFPMVDLTYYEEDLVWLRGISCRLPNGDPANISSLKQKTQLKMDETGVAVRSIAEGDMIITSPGREKEPYVIDSPFVLIFCRKKFQLPLASFWVTEESWQNPGGLDFD